jgi:hypothetical protein
LEINLKKYLFILLIFFCCTTKNQNVIKEEHFIEEDDIIKVYNRLIEGIKNRDINEISSCYMINSSYYYDENTGKKYICFNQKKYISGIENIILQYKFLFKSNILDKIEYEIISIDKNALTPKISFLNVWQNSDDDVIEIIEFEKVQNKYYISCHNIMKK